MQQNNTISNANDIRQIQTEIDFIRQSYSIPETQSNRTIQSLAEKISIALYMVTQHLSENDSLRLSMRHNGTDLVLHMGSKRHGYPTQNDWLRVLISINDTLISQVKIARNIRAITEHNTYILERELTRFGQMLAHEYIKTTPNDFNPVRDGFETRMHIESLFADNPLPAVAIARESRPVPHSVIRQQQTGFSQVKSTENLPRDQVKNSTESQVKNPIFNQQFSDGRAVSQNSTTTKPITSSNSLRKPDILSFIRARGRVTTRDIAAAVPGFSEKSLQRTLVQLINDGLILRIGDKRWAQYEIV